MKEVFGWDHQQSSDHNFCKILKTSYVEHGENSILSEKIWNLLWDHFGEKLGEPLIIQTQRNINK